MLGVASMRRWLMGVLLRGWRWWDEDLPLEGWACTRLGLGLVGGPWRLLGLDSSERRGSLVHHLGQLNAGGLTASSYAARRLGTSRLDCRATRRAWHPALSPASRVSISELLARSGYSPETWVTVLSKDIGYTRLARSTLW
jgi:hypothetical protein